MSGQDGEPFIAPHFDSQLEKEQWHTPNHNPALLFEFQFKQLKDEDFERLEMTVHTVPSKKVTESFEWIRVEDSPDDCEPSGWYKMKRLKDGRLVHFDKIVLDQELLMSRDAHMRRMERGNDFTIHEQVITSIEQHGNRLKGAILSQSKTLGHLFKQQSWNFAMVFGPLIRTEPETGLAAMARIDGTYWTKVNGLWYRHTLPRDESLDVQFRPSEWKSRLFAD